VSLNPDDLLGRMTLEEKVGQLFFLAFAAERLDEAQVLFEQHFVGGSYLSNDNLPNARAAADLTRTVQGFAGRTRLGIPLLLGADQEGAWSVMADSCPGPGNMALGATGDPAHARRMFEVIGAELAAVGVDVVLAPVADCNTNPRNASIGVRSFGEDPGLVGDMTAAAVEGVLAGGALPTIKHYPGHGDTTVDSHRGLPTVERGRDDLFAIDLAPFARGVAAGVPIVMTAHIVFPALDPDRPATLSPVILRDVLRRTLGFEGVVLSDSMNMQSMRRNYDPADSAIQAIAAGVDLVMLAEEHYDHDAARYLERQVALIVAVQQAVREGRLPEARVDEAVGRVLRLKQRLDPDRTRSPETVGSPANRAVESAAAEAAVAVLRTQHGLVPLAPETPVTLVNTTTRDAYAVLGHTRGIGPNQTQPAFDLLATALRARRPELTVLGAEEVLEGSRPDPGSAVVAVTESHLLPGMDFDQRDRADVLAALHTYAAGRMLVVGLRDPYELGDLPFVTDYLCAFSSRPCAAEAVARVLTGEIQAEGASPVSIPGTGVEARRPTSGQ
jgi:beta-N-acetylhexosaminidase